MQLDPGHPAAGRLPSGSRLPARAVLPTQRLDDALQAFDARTRQHIARSTAPRRGSTPIRRARQELNDTIGSFGDTLAQMRELDRSLTGQRGALRDLVSNSRSVLDELASRRTRSGRSWTPAGRAPPRSPRTGMRCSRRSPGARRCCAPRVGRSTRSRRWIPRARTVVGTLNAAAPHLTPALAQLRPVARSAGTLIRSLPAFDRVALPFLRRLTTIGRLAQPVLARLDPALRDLVPTVGYLAPYRHEVLGFLEAGAGAARKLQPDGTTLNTATLADLEDYKRRYDKNGFTDQGVNGAPYGWGRFFVDNTAIAGDNGGLGVNPYPKPGQPYAHFDGTTRACSRSRRWRPDPPAQVSRDHTGVVMLRRAWPRLRPGRTPCWAALDELGAERLAEIAFEALEAELPLLRAEPDLSEAARASVLANVGLVLDFASGAASLAISSRHLPAAAFTRELARRNVPVAELDRAYGWRSTRCGGGRWPRCAVASPTPPRGGRGRGALRGRFVTGDALTGVVMARYAAERERWVRSADAVRKATVDEILDGSPMTWMPRRDGWATSCASRTRPSSSGPRATTPCPRARRSPSAGPAGCSCHGRRARRRLVSAASIRRARAARARGSRSARRRPAWPGSGTATARRWRPAAWPVSCAYTTGRCATRTSRCSPC